MKTPLEQLEHWLNHPIYDNGVVLYESLIGPGFLLSMLKTGEDAYNRQKLVQALEARRDELVAQEASRKASYPVSLTMNLEQGKLLQDERMLIKDRMRTLYNSGISESEELRVMAFRILAIKAELDNIYGRRDFFEQSGLLPEDASLAEEQESPEQLLRRRNTLRTYVSKYTALLKQHFDAPRQRKYKAKLDGFQQELFSIETRLSTVSSNAPPL